MLKFEIILEESTADVKKEEEGDSDVEEEEAKKKAEEKQTGPQDPNKPQHKEVIQELPPNTDLARRNQELEHRMRDITVDSESLRIQLGAMQRQVSDLQAQAERAEREKEAVIKDREAKQGEVHIWEEKCKTLEGEVAKLKEDLVKAKAAQKPKVNFSVDDI